MPQILVSHERSDSTYGAPRILGDLQDTGEFVGRKRVALLMREAGLVGVSRRRFVTTKRRVTDDAAPDLVERNFTADTPNQLWIADITYVPTRAGFLYLSVVLDAFSRRIVGWAMATHLETELVLDALEMALEQRRPDAVIHHSDHGSVHLACIRKTVRGNGSPSLDGLGRRCLRQCHGRELLRDPGVRAS